MSIILGLIIAFSSIYFSILAIGQDITKYYDLVALLMVPGGTLAVAVMTFPWDLVRDSIDSFKSLIFGTKDFHDSLVVAECLNYIKNKGDFSRLNKSAFSRSIMRDGKEMISFDFSEEDISEILTTRIEENYERNIKIGGFIRSLAKYPPAFGLAGTVLALVNIMSEVGSGADPAQAGFLMAIALVTTLYGLLLSNLIISPIGEKLFVNANKQRGTAEIALQAVLLLKNDSSLLKAQEILNSFIHPRHRVNFIESAGQEIKQSMHQFASDAV